jgi:hypothetical protein
MELRIERMERGALLGRRHLAGTKALLLRLVHREGSVPEKQGQGERTRSYVREVTEVGWAVGAMLLQSYKSGSNNGGLPGPMGSQRCCIFSKWGFIVF